MEKMICIVCPIGCSLEAERRGADIIVSGNQCRRGETYARTELISPKRVVTSLMPVKGGGVVSCKTNGTIDKQLIFPLLKLIKSKCAALPIKIGDVLIENALGSGTDIVATSDKD